MRRYAAYLLVLLVIGLAQGCGGESGTTGNPQAPPPNFDPAGGATPDMTGKTSQPKT